ncbi:MAG: glycosyltransferase [Alphaproteobacteria bacterium]|nr:glycosyltransferase [Alphaproteobacteria bacterium]
MQMTEAKQAEAIPVSSKSSKGEGLSGGRKASGVDLTVIVTFDSDQVDEALLERYREVLDSRGESYEVLCFFNARMSNAAKTVEDVAGSWPQLKPLAQRPWRGEDGAVAQGINRAAGNFIMTLPGWFEFAPEDINKLIDNLGHSDMAVGRRVGGDKSWWQKLRMSVFQGLIRILFGHSFNDVFSRTRLGRAEMFRQISDYGVRQHFLPLLAVSSGYGVVEVDLRAEAQSGKAAAYRFKPLAHIAAGLDVLSLFVVLKFLQRPLRFFGSIGLTLAAVGGLITAWLIFARLVLGDSLADRPLLIFSVMMVVLGIQIIALGLIGEIVIFSSSRRAKTYSVEKVVGGGGRSNDGGAVGGGAVGGEATGRGG